MISHIELAENRTKLPQNEEESSKKIEKKP